MSELKKLLEEYKIPNEKLNELTKTIKDNPMAAMAHIQQLQLPPDFFQKIMSIVMTNPNAAMDFASDLGISKDTVKELEKNLKPSEESTKDS